MLFGELLADTQPVALVAANVVELAQGLTLLKFDDAVAAAAKATAVVVASDGADNDVSGVL